MVIPKPLRDQVGLIPGEVELVVDGGGVRIEPISSDDVEEREGRLVIPETGAELTSEVIEALRRADQR